MSDKQEKPSTSSTSTSAYDPFRPYVVTSRGTNDQGNRYDTRIQPSGPAYRYSNKDSSYGYKNGDGSKYYKSESGRAVYTAPNGVKYDKSEYHEPQPSTRYDYNASQQPAYDGRASNGSASPSRYGGRDYFQHEYADRNENSGRYEERTQSHPYHNTTPKEEQESYQSKDMSPWESHDRHEESYEEHGHGDYDNGDDEHYEEQDDGGYDDGEYAYDYHYDFY